MTRSRLAGNNFPQVAELESCLHLSVPHLLDFRRCCASSHLQRVEKGRGRERGEKKAVAALESSGLSVRRKSRLGIAHLLRNLSTCHAGFWLNKAENAKFECLELIRVSHRFSRPPDLGVHKSPAQTRQLCTNQSGGNSSIPVPHSSHRNSSHT